VLGWIIKAKGDQKMELLVLMIVAGVVGYLIAGTRFRKPIDDTAEKVADSTRSAAGNVEGWFSRTFRREKKPKEEVLDAEGKAASPAEPVEATQPAAKQTSRRRGEGDSEPPPG
jgi:hypothetical protein